MSLDEVDVHRVTSAGLSRMPKLTQREFAARLGLSYRTVSRVFNGDVHVGEPTRQRVLREAERLGFRGHTLARALRLKRSFGIGVVLSNTPHSFWTEVLSAMEVRAREAGYHVVICHRGREAGAAGEIRFLLEHQVDAVVLAPHPRHENPAALRAAAVAGKPLLMLNNRLPHFPAHYLGTDSRTGARRACEHLLRLGHRRITFLAGPAGDYTAESRLAGYRDAMRVAGMLEEELTVLPAGWNQEDGANAARDLLALRQPSTAVMAVNDAVAIGVYLGLRRAGVRVPDDLALVGYSGDRAGELLATPLTTVAQPTERLGRRAAELLLELLDEEPAAPHFEELEDALVVRESCGSHLSARPPSLQGRGSRYAGSAA